MTTSFKNEKVVILHLLFFIFCVSCEKLVDVAKYDIQKEKFLSLQKSKTIPKINEWNELVKADTQKLSSKFSTNYADSLPKITRYLLLVILFKMIGIQTFFCLLLRPNLCQIRLQRQRSRYRGTSNPPGRIPFSSHPQIPPSQ